MSDGLDLRFERTFQAPAARVFEAWTSEEVMRRWFHGEHHWETTEAEVDLRLGGAVRVSCATPTKTPSSAAAAPTPRSTRRPGSPSPGPRTTTTAEP